MTLRAAIFDLYGTLLEFGPAPPDADARWAREWQATLGRPPRLGLAEFTAACRAVVAAEHTAARAAGITCPEVFWPAIVDTVLPEFAAVPTAIRADSPIYGADLLHSIRVMPGAVASLRAAREASLLLGLASNCQPYTLREFDTAFAGTGLTRAHFDPRLTFLSFDHGFSKPNPHVFRLLTARLRALGIAPHETLMVGDREDNDLEPARLHGWTTARIGRNTAAADWERLQKLFRPPPPASHP